MTEAKEDLVGLCTNPAMKFIGKWVAGETPLPYTSCTADHLYQGFRLWMDWAGEKGSISKERFSAEVARLIDRNEIGIVRGRSYVGSVRCRAYRLGDIPLDGSFETSLGDFRRQIWRDRPGP
jgi:hypothetical protein